MRKIIFLFVGVAVISAACYFILHVVDIPEGVIPDANLVVNPSFEEWDHDSPTGWTGDSVIWMKTRQDIVDGRYALGIASADMKLNGIQQTIKVDSIENYDVFFSIRSTTMVPKISGYEIEYEGNPSATVDVAPGVHYHENGMDWQQYFGRVTGATSITLRFFSQKRASTYVDHVGVGIKIKSDGEVADE